MEELKFLEQDIINSVCLFYARELHVLPEDVEVELMFDDLVGFGAEASTEHGQTVLYNENNMIAGIRLYLDEFMDYNPNTANITLHLDDEEGIIAQIQYP